MSYREHLKDLLAPLGVYSWNGSLQEAELGAAGASLDRCHLDLEEIGREGLPETARSWGLEKLCSLLARSPVAESPQALALAVAALLRIGDKSFTLKAMQDNLSGCGVPALVEEGAQLGTLAVSFPGMAGIPADFSELQGIIEDILPCHLEIGYVFWFIRWRELERDLPSWRALENLGLSWKKLEGCVSPD